MKQLFRTLWSCTALLLIGTLAHAATPVVSGRADVGKTKISLCIGCHGIPNYQSSFPQVHKVPKISGQSEKYIIAALTAYQAGDRKHPTMTSVAASLSEQDIHDIAAYYSHNVPTTYSPPPKSPPVPNAQVAALLQKGACVSCHGTNFSEPSDAATPKLAGQHADYLYVALKAYKTEKNPHYGRAQPIMGSTVKPFSDAELKALANYVGSIPGGLYTLPQSRVR